jgi:tetratricopeptide (TPR) repeat protein
MDSKERHEMKTNELADWLDHVPGFLKQYQNLLIGLALIVIGLISWPILNRWRQQSDFTAEAAVSEMLDSLEMGKYLAVRPNENQQDSAAGSFLVTANNLAEQAKKAPNNNLAAIALIKRGQALRTDLLYRKEIIAEDAAAAQIKQAQEAYQQAFDKAVLPSVKAMAQFGLGICSEELGQFDQAKEIYQKIATEASYAGTPLPMAAEDRIKKMTDNNAKYTFVEKPKAASAPAQIQAPALPAMPFASPAPAKTEPAKTESSGQGKK